MEIYKYRQILPIKYGKFFLKEKIAGQLLPTFNINEPEFSALSLQDRFQNATEVDINTVFDGRRCKRYANFLDFINFYNALHTVAVSNERRQILPMVKCMRTSSPKGDGETARARRTP